MRCPNPTCGAELEETLEQTEDGRKQYWCAKCGLYYNYNEKTLTLLAADRRDEATEELVKEIKNTYKIYTTRDDQNPEMWIYNNGIYIPEGETFIREFCRQRLDLAFKNVIASQVVDKIQADTYIDSDTFFNQPDIGEIPVKNGLLNLATRELSPFTPDKVFFAKVPVDYDKAAVCPTIDTHFKTVIKYAEDVPVLYEMFGYCLNREPFLETAFMMIGSGRNGKTKTAGLLNAFLGAENCSAVQLQDMGEERFSKFEMFGKLANINPDLPPTVIKGQTASVFKTTTGRDVVEMDRKFKNPIRSVIYAKQIYGANELPRSADHNLAFWSRWIPLEFPYTFVTQTEYDQAEDKTNLKIKDEDILLKLAVPSELSGLLNAALDGLDRLKKNRAFSHTKTAAEVEDLWIRKSDSFAAFWKDCLIEQWDANIAKSDLRRVYNTYCRINKIKPMSDKAILYFMSEKGISDDRFRGEGKQTPIWVGCAFKENEIFGKVGMDGMAFSTYIQFEDFIVGGNMVTKSTMLTTFTDEEELDSSINEENEDVM